MQLKYFSAYIWAVSVSFSVRIQTVLENLSVTVRKQLFPLADSSSLTTKSNVRTWRGFDRALMSSNWPQGLYAFGFARKHTRHLLTYLLISFFICRMNTRLCKYTWILFCSKCPLLSWASFRNIQCSFASTQSCLLLSFPCIYSSLVSLSIQKALRDVIRAAGSPVSILLWRFLYMWPSVTSSGNAVTICFCNSFGIAKTSAMKDTAYTRLMLYLRCCCSGGVVFSLDSPSAFL